MFSQATLYAWRQGIGECLPVDHCSVAEDSALIIFKINHYHAIAPEPDAFYMPKGMELVIAGKDDSDLVVKVGSEEVNAYTEDKRTKKRTPYAPFAERGNPTGLNTNVATEKKYGIIGAKSIYYEVDVFPGSGGGRASFEISEVCINNYSQSPKAHKK